MVLLVSEFRPDSCVVAEVKASPNHGERQGGAKPDMLVLHYTGMRDSQARARASVLADQRSLRPLRRDGRRPHRAMRAGGAARLARGQSSWAGETDINSCSIGIEIANPGHDYGYPDFPRRQIAAVIALCRSIFTRHRIPADRVLAHSDVAPSRKKDPGEKFPWRTAARFRDRALGEAGADHAKPGRIFVLGDSDPERRDAADVAAQLRLRDRDTGRLPTPRPWRVVAAFQRHFRPAKVDGVADVSTVATLGRCWPRATPRATRRLQITMLGLRRFWSQSIRLTCRTSISQRPSRSTKRWPHQPDRKRTPSGRNSLIRKFERTMRASRFAVVNTSTLEIIRTVRDFGACDQA